MIDYKKKLLECVRSYFAPLTAVWKAIVEEYKKLGEQRSA
jgi:hypothetical protein